MSAQPVNRFLDADGQVRQWPTKHTDKELVLEYLATKFEVGKSYSEREVNDVLKAWHTFQDWPLLRRELYDRGYLNRNPDGSNYHRVNRSD